MRFGSVACLALLGALGSVVACFPGVGDDSEDQGADLTGTSKEVESPIVFLFDRADADGRQALPSCSGAQLNKRMVVTARSCARPGLLAGRAADSNGHGTRANVLAVHLPPEADAEIAVVELDSDLPGVPALITRAPLREGYAVNGAVSASTGILGTGILGETAGQGGTIKGRLISETATQALLLPTVGGQICKSDMGASVCSSTSMQKTTFFNSYIRGTCGLSALVVGAPDAPATTVAAPGTQAPTTPAALGANGCSPNAWKVATLGRHAAFLKQLAPEAFQPIVTDLFVEDDDVYQPDGLWGFHSGTTVQSAKLTTATVTPGMVGVEVPLTAVATFGNILRDSDFTGRFGIAPKANPTAMRWLPAKEGSRKAQPGNMMEVQFTGSVNAMVEGDYVVGFRASGNGGETWTQGDLDGSENGFTQLLALRIGANPAMPPPAVTPPPVTTPPGTPPVVMPGAMDGGVASADGGAKPDGGGTLTSSNPLLDPPTANPVTTGDDVSPDYEQKSDDSDGGATPTKKKKKASSSSCAVTAPGTNVGSGLPALGLLLGLAAFARRRRA